ncbi:MAG TPA: hypothetical protein DER23_06165 [Clostridiales bacterium]|jgi:hypothetical protein|nr:hypothetical protein [Clostridiales bacterium]
MRRMMGWMLLLSLLFCGCRSKEPDTQPQNGETDQETETGTNVDVGVSTVCINPREENEITLAGFGNDNRGYDGILDDIEVGCVVFSANGVKCAVIAADILGWDMEIMAQLRERVERELGIPQDNLLFNASHSHSGPTTQKNTVGIGVVSESYNAYLTELTFQCMQQAAGDLETCRLYKGTAPAENVAINRRRVVNGTMQMSPNPNEACCNECDVIVAKRGNSFKVVLFSFGSHPSILNGNYISAEFVGAARTVIENRYEGATAIFVQGCGGDAKANITDETQTRFISNRYEDVYILGNRLAQDIIRYIDGGKLKSVKGDVAVKVSRFSLQLQKNIKKKEDYVTLAEENRGHYLHKVYRWYYDHYDELATEVPFMLQRIDLGDSLTIVAMMGEVVWGYDAKISALMPNRTVVVAGYSNGVYGYICTAKMYPEGGYEPDRSTTIYQLPAGYLPETESNILSSAAQLCGGGSE